VTGTVRGLERMKVDTFRTLQVTELSESGTHSFSATATPWVRSGPAAAEKLVGIRTRFTAIDEAWWNAGSMNG
jgi:hypothetical protein